MTNRSAEAVRLVGVGRLERFEMPLPEPGPEEVLIRVLSVGLCGSDAHWFEEGGIGDSVLPDGGVVPGHEFCGVIESGPRTGERVAIDPAIACLRCEQCLAGRFHLCLRVRFAGHGSTPGALRSHLVWPERCLVTLPENVSDEQGSLLEPLGIALHALDIARLEGNEPVAVLGCGPIGLLTISTLAALGVDRIGAEDPLAHRMDAALGLGAHRIDRAHQVEGHFDAVFDCAGSDDSLHAALQLTKPGGRVMMVGVPEGDRTSFQASLARRKEIALLACRRMLPADLERAAGLARDRLVALDGLITHRYPSDRDRSGIPDPGDTHRDQGHRLPLITFSARCGPVGNPMRSRLC